MTAQKPLPFAIVDALNKLSGGPHAGYRANHAKGIGERHLHPRARRKSAEQVGPVQQDGAGDDAGRRWRRQRSARDKLVTSKFSKGPRADRAVAVAWQGSQPPEFQTGRRFSLVAASLPAPRQS